METIKISITAQKVNKITKSGVIVFDNQDGKRVEFEYTVTYNGVLDCETDITCYSFSNKNESFEVKMSKDKESVMKILSQLPKKQSSILTFFLFQAGDALTREMKKYDKGSLPKTLKAEVLLPTPIDCGLFV